MQKRKIKAHPRHRLELPLFEKIDRFVDSTSADLALHDLILYEVERKDGGAQELQTRRSRTYHKKISGPGLEIFTSTLAAQRVSLGGLENTFDYILDDVSGLDQPFNEWLYDYLRARLKFGLVGVVVDGPERLGQTEADRLRLNERAFLCMYEPSQIVTWDHFTSGPRRGQFRQVVVAEDPILNTDGTMRPRLRRFFFEDDSLSSRYLVEILEKHSSAEKQVDPFNIGLSEGEDWEVVATIPGALTEIPFVMWGRGFRSSAFADVLDLECAAFNVGSIKTSINYRQGFRQTIVAGASNDELKMIGESRINKLKNPDARVFDIPAGEPKAVNDEQQDIEQRALRIMMRQFSRIIESKQVESADSKEHDASALSRFYDKTLDQAQRKLASIFSFVGQFEGNPQQSINVSFTRNYGLEDRDTAIVNRQTLLMAAKEGNMPRLYKELVKVAASGTQWVTDQNKTQEQIQSEVFADIESAQFNTFDAMASNFGMTLREETQ